MKNVLIAVSQGTSRIQSTEASDLIERQPLHQGFFHPHGKSLQFNPLKVLWIERPTSRAQHYQKSDHTPQCLPSVEMKEGNQSRKTPALRLICLSCD